jgi:hypothetical protein
MCRQDQGGCSLSPQIAGSYQAEDLAKGTALHFQV